MSKAYDKAFKDKIIKERLSGLSYKAISIIHGISVSVIYKWMKYQNEVPPIKKTLFNVTELIKPQVVSFKLNGHLVLV